MLDAIAASGQRPWCELAGSVAIRIARKWSLRVQDLSWLRDATTALYTLRPNMVSPQARTLRQAEGSNTLGFKADSAADAATKTAMLVTELQATAGVAGKAATDAVRWEQMWRPRQMKGWRVDMSVLEDELAAARATADEFTKTLGIDLASARSDSRKAEVLAQLAEMGIALSSLSHDAIDAVVVADLPERAKLAWQPFRDAYSASWRLSKILEIKRAAERGGGRVYSTLMIRGARTGRASSSRIALQNIPRNLRHLLVADEGNVLVALDLSNAEPRVAAALSGDESLLADIYSPDGVYASLARKIWGESAFKDGVVIKAYRELAKNVFLQTMYGAQDETLASKLGVSLSEARQRREQLWAAYPKLAAYQARLLTDLRAGRVMRYTNGRPMPTPKGRHAMLNAAVQGQAADVFYQKMEAVLSKLQVESAFLPIHDELVVEVPARFADLAQSVLVQEMSSEFLGVQMTGDSAILGRSWKKV
ncbi:DNA polymerase [Leifsonia sp. L25]|uniref:DNA polymerase n=1 Tax=Leifsonia sp. L25 TaxID=3423957 RepID=UPI003D684A71